MTCEACRGRMVDVLYGEEIDAEDCFAFFQHLNTCSDCEAEYLDFLQTRETLGRWNLSGESSPLDLRVPEARFPWARPAILRGGWQLLQKAAAAFLILVGAASILQGIGVWQTDRLTFSDQQLMQLVNDMIVLRQAEERKVIGQALANFAEELDLQQRRGAQEVSQQMEMLMRHLDSLEENGLYLKASSTQ